MNVAAPYWRLRHAIWDFREALLIRLLSRHMSRTTTLYVHPRCGGPARAVVRLLDEEGVVIAPTDPYDHDHVEGRSPYAREERDG